MNEKIVEQMLDELFFSFEDSETHSRAILLFLKNQGIATDEQLAPYLAQGGQGEQRAMAGCPPQDGCFAGHSDEDSRRGRKEECRSGRES